tara:strand:- start:339 stop:578 length:240 start_codon:yes stop_codon:yes gene_type:complete
MNEIITIIGIIIGGLFVSFMRGRKKTAPMGSSAPKNEVADVAREISDKEFQENLKAIKEDLEGDSPADDLASRGNARRR